MTAAAATRLPFWTKAGFTSGQIAGQVFRDIPSILLLFYLTSVVGLEPAIAGTAIFVPKVFFGVMADLGVGMVSDRLNTRFPRRNWLLVGAVLAPAALVLIFMVPDGSAAFRAGYVFLVMSIYMLAFATATVPYLAQYSEITDSPRERCVLMAWRHGYTGAGILVGSAMAPAVIHHLGGTPWAYGATAALLAVICVISLVVAYFAAARFPARTIRAAPPVRLAALRAVFAYRPFRLLLGIFFAQEVAAGMSGASIAFFLTYNMKMSDALANLGIISLTAGFVVILASPFWIYVSNKIGKKQSYIWGAVAHAVLILGWASSTVDTPLWVIFSIAAGIGLANSGWGIMVLALLGDMIAESARATGEDHGGSFSAVWTLTEKIGLALGATLIAGLVLSSFGFSSALAASGGTQSDSALRGIALTFGYAPFVINLLAALTYWRFGRAAETSSLVH